MNYGDTVWSSYSYTKKALCGHIPRWLALAAGIIIFPFIIGYLLRVVRGEEEPPTLGDLGELFIQGILGFLIMLVYMVIAMVILVIVCLIMAVVCILGLVGTTTFDPNFLTGGWSAFGSVAALYGFFFLLYAIAMPLLMAYSVFCLTALIRYARSGHISDAFRISAILEDIRSIGWLNLILGIWAVQLVVGIILYAAFGLSALVASPFIMGGMGMTLLAGVILLILWLLFLVPLQIFVMKFYADLYRRIPDPAQN